MNPGELKPSFFVARELMADLYKGDISKIDFVVLLVLFDHANHMNGIATLSYHGIADYINKPTNTIKNAMKRLSESGRIVMETTKQGQKSFRIGVVNYRIKGKPYSTKAYFDSIFVKNQYDNCKAEEIVAKSDVNESAKPETNILSHEMAMQYIKNAKSLLDDPAKSIEIEKNI